MRTYLYGIALKLVAAERRKLTRDPAPEQPDAVGGAAENVLWIQQALEKLDPFEREILMLREYEQLSYGEIADLLRLPVNTVRSRLFRSRLALRQYLEPASRSTSRHDMHIEPEELLAYLDGELHGQLAPQPRT
jgi:DNA-directed RNA polymerase specialized sigma24 family protein